MTCERNEKVASVDSFFSLCSCFSSRCSALRTTTHIAEVGRPSDGQQSDVSPEHVLHHRLVLLAEDRRVPEVCEHRLQVGLEGAAGGESSGLEAIEDALEESLNLVGLGGADAVPEEGGRRD